METRVENVLELWGGVECTFNRVRDQYFDQLKYNGHQKRIDDLDLFAEFGLKTLRSPFLWEKIMPDSPASADWEWAAARLARMKRLGITPIAGLLHHGSGPRSTSLLDPEFPERFCIYAQQFARRFPEVENYTPINEPLTTARFSGLYGRWYPHCENELDFVKMLLGQCRGIVLAMREIRKVNPAAKLVQTEDLGKASGTALMAYQVEHENERRWLTTDLLCGRVNQAHYLWKHLLEAGAAPSDILWFQDNQCPPDILGFNHYILSNRFLDDRISRYPRRLRGGNGRHRYADAEAVRVSEAVPVKIDQLMTEAWDRYHLPLAVTEIHLDCTREEQMRWLHQNFDLCKKARARGVDVRAVTAWGLLGHFDWHRYVTRRDGYYESGVFDLRDGTPRATGLAYLVKELATTGKSSNPVLEIPGWWERPERAAYPKPSWPPEKPTYSGRPILIAAGQGTLGQAFANVCDHRALPYKLLSADDLNWLDPISVTNWFAEYKPWAVINAACYGPAESWTSANQNDFLATVQAALVLGRECHRTATSLVSFSSDLILAGFYSRAEAEEKLLELCPAALLVRTSSMFGPWDHANFLYTALELLRKGESVVIPGGAKISPTYVPDLVNVCLDLLLDRTRGVVHLTNQGEINWGDFTKLAAVRAKLDPECVVEHPTLKLAPTPSAEISSEVVERGNLMRPLSHALDHYFALLAQEQSEHP